ncbi:WXG100 family type VII secretion target [Nocardia transvalensis]|uniref:WXG100 family type VII secretion target n=1 Tax=Nocardia transvalensis TaxID=37333 RepID=UPI00189385F4|nr:WXG100 family type VII secretion target [Nocardia transvalensis]MBF6327563.1 WXG100 family type VII secretion target [Nocardia transvalensis]
MSAGGGLSESGQSVFVVPEDVQAVGQYVYDIAGTLKQALDSAARDVETLLTSDWTGDAADEFKTGWDETRDGGNQLLQALTGLAEKLGVSAAGYRNTDSAHATGISSLNL